MRGIESGIRHVNDICYHSFKIRAIVPRRFAFPVGYLIARRLKNIDRYRDNIIDYATGEWVGSMLKIHKAICDIAGIDYA